MQATKQWDIFCKVIDNFGDIGVCWRLACDLGARGHRARLWVDDASALRWMAPGGAPGVEVRAWTTGSPLPAVTPGDVLIEAFGCQVATEFIAAYAHRTWASGQNGHWINLEYLSAQGYALRCHGLPSPVLSGPGAGLAKHFFYPGFSPGTGGLLREPDLVQRRAAFDPARWLRSVGLRADTDRLVSLFCYEPALLSALLQQLASDSRSTRLLVTPGRSVAAVRRCLTHLRRSAPAWNRARRLQLTYLPRLSQLDFDHLLWSCDLNFVRGEDSLVRALWANKPLIWQIYAQQDGAHHAKLLAFLDVVGAPASLQAFHLAWNGLRSGPLPDLDLTGWGAHARRVSAELTAQTDLTQQLIEFVEKNR